MPLLFAEGGELMRQRKQHPSVKDKNRQRRFRRQVEKTEEQSERGRSLGARAKRAAPLSLVARRCPAGQEDAAAAAATGNVFGGRAAWKPRLTRPGHRTMDGGPDSLAMVVHLLAKPGHAVLLQHTLDQLQEWVCLDVRLFLVSERPSPIKYYETYHQKSTRFPGTSILLFLHEDFGEERLFHVHDFFQHPPWHRVHVECASSGKPSPQALECQDFYGLDEHMPVWGLRQVHYGTEIVRITLYCSFDNYDDAVKLYEMILQKKATVQKSSFCAFVLYATQSIAVQLCLKQLPVGLGVDSKESSVLQFKVHEIGQLVPLLPNPCIPISSTRWQTEDYEGNRILLQVQGISNRNENQVSSCSWHNTVNEGSLPLRHTSPSPLAPRRVTIQQKNRTLRAVKNKHKFARGVECTLETPYALHKALLALLPSPIDQQRLLRRIWALPN
ncbi:hypothetical protein JRQ81_017885 [Phrynocephalus forsythii]|uniref:FAM124 domain-containing protein n=1 Tax=Phrynocephalus forsythii TaxID=171643 RepID=A0A9Q1B0X9_9SAUR|nr:hypothetical protein JRQ81_017885 [Phrynocephalus forsythii]